MSLLEVKNLKKVYTTRFSSQQVTALSNVSFSVEEGEYVAIMGESGSGKTTLLMLLAGLDEPKEGSVLYRGEDIKDIGYDNYHKKDVQIIFQNYNLLNYLNAYDNILTAISITDKKRKVNKDMLNGYLSRFGIDENKAKRKVNKLSGGEQQRVAIARAVACDGEIILADEPTGNLDYETSLGIIILFRELVETFGKTIIMVTHNNELANMCDHVVRIDQKTKNVL